MNEKIARFCHEINRAYCIGIGDNSQKPWDEAEQWQRDSAIDGLRFHMENPDAGPGASHENWMKFKIEDGWVYGDVKDTEKKTHPCLVNYVLLPVEQRMKDSLFVTVVKECCEFAKGIV